MSKINTFDPRKRGLGRGLDALFESNEDNNEIIESSTPVLTSPIDPKTVLSEPPLEENKHEISLDKPKTLSISSIIPGANQPRKSFDEEGLSELAESIKKIGIIQPLLVRPTEEDGLYELIAGERRWRAAQKAQLHDVPVIIRKIKDTEVLQIGLIENLQREDLNPVEEAIGYQNLMHDFGHSQQQVADLVGKSRSHIANMLRLTTLPKEILEMLRSGDLSAGHARALVGRDNALDLAKRIISEGLSVRAIEVISDRKSKVAEKAPEAVSIKDANIYALEKELSEKLGLVLKINFSGNSENGDVRIKFQSSEQLNYIIEKLNKNVEI